MSELNLVTLKRQMLIKDTEESVWDLTWYLGLEVRKQVLIPARSLTLEGSHMSNVCSLSCFIYSPANSLGPVLFTTLHRQYTSITDPEHNSLSFVT